MIPWDEVKKHLPQYLSAESLSELYSELEAFPPEEYHKFYSLPLLKINELFQGDGLSKMPIVRLPDKEVRNVPVMILSNTCDNSVKNIRDFPINLTYAPIVSLAKLVMVLKDDCVNVDKITSFTNAVKKQEITQMFYLPSSVSVEEESVVLLDNINNHDNNIEPEAIKYMRTFALGNFGFYLLLFKLSLHFTRIRERVDRDMALVL